MTGAVKIDMAQLAQLAAVGKPLCSGGVVRQRLGAALEALCKHGCR
jgi:hypothetical protein